MRSWISAVSCPIVSSRYSIWASSCETSSAWCSLKRPSSAARSAGSFARSSPLARSASACGSDSPSQRARSIAFPEAPSGRLATEASLMLASSSTFCSRLASRPRPGQRLAIAGRVAQLADRLRRHEARPQQAVLEQLAEPLGVLHVGLAPGHVLDVLGVDEQQLEIVLERVV